MMKKLICAIAAASLILAGCGKETALVDNGDGAYVVIEKKPAETLPKVKPNRTGSDTSAAAEGTSGESAESPSEAGTENKNDSNNSGGGNTADSKDNSSVTDDNSGTADTPGEGASPAATDKNGAVVTNDKSSQGGNVPTVTTTAGNGNTGNSKPAENGDKQEAQPDEPAGEIYYLEGIVYKNTNGTLLIKEPDLSWVTVDFRDRSAAKNVEIGDDVLITYDGELRDGSPSEASDAYSVEVKRKAGYDYELQTFECKNEEVDLCFSMLIPEDWESKGIAYPTEGDFTDWGIRFCPSGSSNGLDVSWHSSFSVREPYDIKTISVNGTEVKRYSKDNKWRFYVFDNDYIASNTFYGKEGYNEYLDEIEFMLETIEFGHFDFLDE